MKPKAQDRLLILAITALCLAALVYGGIAMIAWLAGRGVSFRDFDGAAWTQAIGSVAAILALVWQRSHEVWMARAEGERAAAEQQNGARRLVQMAVNICAEFADDRWPQKGTLSDSDCGFYSARVQTVAGALRRIDAHALPSWRHTESIMVAISAMDAITQELGRQTDVRVPAKGRVAKRAAVVAPAWMNGFKAMAKQFHQQLAVRAWVMEQGLDQTIDPA